MWGPSRQFLGELPHTNMLGVSEFLGPSFDFDEISVEYLKRKERLFLPVLKVFSS